MAFFEDLGKKLSDVGQGVASQAKNLAELTKLNSAVNDKEKQITQLYTAMGKAYFEAHKADETPAYEEIAAILTLQAEILACQEEIKQIKGIVKCPNCGADIPLDAAFCNGCGAKAPERNPAPAPEAANRFCPNCGGALNKDAAFCKHCGTRL